MKRRIYTPRGDSGILQPIELGGTNARNAKDAAKNLNLLTYDDLNKPNNAVTLNAGGFIDKAYLPHDYQAGNKPLLDGVFHTYPNGVTHIRITNYDSFTTYNLEAHMGTVTRNYDTLTYRAGPDIGAGWIKVNGHKFPIEIRVPRATKPSIIYPINGAENVPRGRFAIKASDFQVAAYVDEHVSTDWQLSRNPEFTDLIINNINDTVNKTNIQTPELHAERKYYVRVRYTARRALQSEWSDTTVFTTTSGLLRGREIQKILNDREKDDDFGVSLAYASGPGMLVIGSSARDVALNHECGSISQFTRESDSFVRKHNIESFTQSKKLDLSIAPGGYVTIHYPELNVSEGYLTSQSVQTRGGVRTVILEGQGEHLKEKTIPGKTLVFIPYTETDNKKFELPDGIKRIHIEGHWVPGSSGSRIEYHRVQSYLSYRSQVRKPWSTQILNPHGGKGVSLSGDFDYTWNISVTQFAPINTLMSKPHSSSIPHTFSYGPFRFSASPKGPSNQNGWRIIPRNYSGPTSSQAGANAVWTSSGLVGTLETEESSFTLGNTYQPLPGTAGSEQILYATAWIKGVLESRLERTDTTPSSPARIPGMYIEGLSGIDPANDIFWHYTVEVGGYKRVGKDAGGYINFPEGNGKKSIRVTCDGVHAGSGPYGPNGENVNYAVKATYESYREPYAVVKPEVTGNGTVTIPTGTRGISVIARAGDNGTETVCSFNGEEKKWTLKGYSSLYWDAKGLGGTFNYQVAPGTVAHIAYISNEGSPPISVQKYTNAQGSFTVPAGVTQLNVWAKLTPKVLDEHGDVIPGQSTPSQTEGLVNTPKNIVIKRDGAVVLTMRRGKGYEKNDTERETILLPDDGQAKNFSYELPEGAELTIEYGTKEIVAKATTISSGNTTYAFGGGVGGLAKPSVRVLHTSEDSYFGWASAISKDGSVMVSGAPGRAVGSVQDSGHHSYSAEKTGSVFVYQREGDNWTIRDIIEPTGSDAQHLSLFGEALAITDDAKSIVIGSPMFNANSKDELGRVEVYTYNQDQRKYVRESEYTSPTNQAHDMLGYAVDVLGDKTVVVASAPGTDDGIKNSGCVYVDTRIGNHYERRKIRATEPTAEAFFGTSVKLCRDGLHLVVGAPGANNGSGALYLFRRETNSPEWTQVAMITNPTSVANERLGTAVEITNDASTIAATAPNRGYREFVRPEGPWSRVTSSRESAVYLFRKSPTGWELGKKITPSDRAADNQNGVGFGSSIAFSPNGDLLMVGAANSNVGGAVYVYD